jgi:hypothetical protein
VIAVLALFALAAPCRAGGQQQGRTVQDLWDVAYLQGARAGYVRTTTREIETDGQNLLRTSVELNLTVKRFNDTVQLRAVTGTDETEAGKVVGVFMKQQLGANKTLTVSGKVQGNQLVLTLDGQHPMKPAPWDDRVLGQYRQLRLFQERKVKPGDRFSYPSFEPTVNLVVTTHVHVVGTEEVEMFGGKMRKRLLRVEVTPERIQNVQLPTMVLWLDDDLTQARSQVQVPGLGQMVLYRATREQALTPAQLAKLTDIGISQLVRLNKTIKAPYTSRSAVFRITVKGEEDVASTFAEDTRQQFKNIKGSSFEMHVRSSGEPAEVKGGHKPKDEFLQSSYFITSADTKVREHAKRAVAAEQDPWKKALRIEKWVHANMKIRTHEALATADHVARTLEGDCTEFAMLTAAMCRAEGIPSRTAIGLIYADVRGKPVMAFHMWTEVWIRGQWLPLDATLGQGYVGACHLKITDHSWHDRRDLTPLLPVLRVLDRLTIEVVSNQ